MQILNYIKSITVISDLIECVYLIAIIYSAVQNHSIFVSHCILAFQNNTVAEFNNSILYLLTGQLYTLYAIDTTDVNKEYVDFAELLAQYLQHFNPTGLPPYKLQLKIGCTVILLNNICSI